MREAEHLLPSTEPELYVALLKRFFITSLPLVADNVLITASRFGDTLFLASGSEKAVLATYTVASAVRQFVLYTNFAMLYALQPIISSLYKEEKFQEVANVLQKSFLLCCLLSIPWMIGLYNIEEILEGLGQDSAIASGCASYFKVYIWGFPASLMIEALMQFFLSIEKPIFIVPLSLLRTVFDLSLSASLILGARKELYGLGISAALYPWLVLLSAVVYLKKTTHFSVYQLFDLQHHDYLSHLRNLIIIGFPIGLGVAIENLSALVKTLLIKRLDDAKDALIADGISTAVMSWANMILISFTSTTSVMIAQSIAQQRPANEKKILWISSLLGLGIALCNLLIVTLSSRALTNAFIDANDTGNHGIVEHTRWLFPIYATGSVAYALKDSFSGALRAHKSTASVMIATTIGAWPITIGLGSLLCFYSSMNIEGFALGQSINYLAVSLMLVFYWRNKYYQKNVEVRDRTESIVDVDLTVGGGPNAINP